MNESPYPYFVLFLVFHSHLAVSYAGKEKTIPSLKSFASKTLLNFKNSLISKEKLQEAIENKEIDFIQCLEFNGQIIQDTDLSHLDLSNINFSGCILIGVNLSYTNLKNANLNGTVFKNTNLKKADLRTVFSNPKNYERCVFNNVDLENALLYGEEKKDYLYLKGNSHPSYDLIYQYSDLKKIAKLKPYQKNTKERKILIEQIDILKNLLTVIALDLENQCLTDFDLIDLNLNNANLKNARLSGVSLSKNVIIPDYKDNDRTPLFDLWVNGNDEKKEWMQILLNCGFNLFRGVSNSKLQTVDWKNKNLENGNFEFADLRRCNFIEVNLKKINLSDAPLGGLYLSRNVILPFYQDNNTTPLFDLWVNGNEEEKEKMQNLINCGVNLFIGVMNFRLQAIEWGSKNLENANFKSADLRRCNFIGVNLQKIRLKDAQLQGVRFSNNITIPYYYASLFDLWIDGDEEEKISMEILLHGGVNIFKGVVNSRLRSINWSYKNLENANFENIDLQSCNFIGTNLRNANLTSTNLKKANLTDADLTGANLTGANLTSARLNNANIKNIQLSYEVQLYKNNPELELQTIYRDTVNYRYPDRELINLIRQIVTAKRFLLNSFEDHQWDLDYIGCRIL